MTTIITDQKDYEEFRVNKLKELGIKMYPYDDIDKSQLISISMFRFKYNHIEHGNNPKSVCQLHGRIVSINSAGNLFFIKINNEDNIIQFMISKRQLVVQDGITFKQFMKVFALGDYVIGSGNPTKTKSGELSLFVNDFKLLSPCLRMIPSMDILDDKKEKLADPETRFRNRSLDFMVNARKRNILIMRHKIIRYIRNFYNRKHFIEVETPVLNLIHGGATAKPFHTELEHLKLPMTMRIAPELYLKKLVIGGLQKVYEIGKQFRNEGMDDTHNPEFTSIETYQVNTNRDEMMIQTEYLLNNMVRILLGSEHIVYQDKKIDFSLPFQRIDMMSELQNKLNIVFPEDYNSPEFREFVIKVCNDKVNISGWIPEEKTTAKILDKLVSIYIEPECINPTFIINHPQIMSPLAKAHRHNSMITERFELFISGFELCNAYTELNDPFIQHNMFEEQCKMASMDDEAHKMDESYIEAMKLGLPPTGGFGMGIDRLVMLFTNNVSIREVIAFPTMKPLK